MTKSEKEKIFRMADGGMEPAYIAAELGLSERQVKYVLTWRKKELEGAEIAPAGGGDAAEDGGEDEERQPWEGAEVKAEPWCAVKAEPGALQRAWKALGVAETLVRMEMTDDTLDMALEALETVEAALGNG